MGRLLRFLLDAMARGLRAMAGRLTPAEAAPVATLEAEVVEDTAGGAPRHWLAMVRTRAPGLHMSLQERGLARVARPLAPVVGPTTLIVPPIRPPVRSPAPVVGPTAPTLRPIRPPARSPAPVVGPTVPTAPSAAATPSALEPRGRQTVPPARSTPSVAPAASVQALPVARPVRPVSADAAAPSAQRPAEAPPDLEPHTWESAAFDDDQQDWTRVPKRHAVSVPPASPAPIPAAVPAVRRLSAADAAVVANWRPPTEASPRAPSPVREARAESDRDEARNETQRPPTRPDLRPLPAAVAVEPARHSTATPVFAPSRDEDHALHRPVRARVTYPTPSPTPLRIEALQAAAEELPAPRFPSLPDEVSFEAPLGGPLARSSTTSMPPVPQSPFFAARRHHDTSELVGAWPTLPAVRVPALHVLSERSLRASPEADRWPELPGDETEEGNDPDLSLPVGHRERLEREQRGLSWNG